MRAVRRSAFPVRSPPGAGWYGRVSQRRRLNCPGLHGPAIRGVPPVSCCHPGAAAEFRKKYCRTGRQLHLPRRTRLPALPPDRPPRCPSANPAAAAAAYARNGWRRVCAAVWGRPAALLPACLLSEAASDAVSWHVPGWRQFAATLKEIAQALARRQVVIRRLGQLYRFQAAVDAEVGLVFQVDD